MNEPRRPLNSFRIGLLGCLAILIVGLGWRVLPRPSTVEVVGDQDSRQVIRRVRQYGFLPLNRWGIRQDVLIACGPDGSFERRFLVLGVLEISDIKDARRAEPGL